MGIRRIAVIMTVFNRKDKTIACLDSLINSHQESSSDTDFEVFITDDNSTDGTREAIVQRQYPFNINIIDGSGFLYWNGGMNEAWKEAVKTGNFDGFLWLNNDTTTLPAFWTDLVKTDGYCIKTYGQSGIYIGSTRDPETKEFSYGGFNFIGKWKLKDLFIMPSHSNPEACQCGHGNITYISANVVKKMGILYDGYIHGGGDHDYTYKAYKAGFPLLVMPEYAGECVNDHPGDGYADFLKMNLRQRLKHLKSPFGCNLHNTLVFQRRCFPHRYPFVFVTAYLKAFFPKFYLRTYKAVRK